MILWILAFLGGFLTILSPCILPVLPFVFSRAEKCFYRNGLPLLLGMAASFALISTLAVVGGGWAVHANEWGRAAALVLLSLFALTLIFPTLAERALHPLASLGGKIQKTDGHEGLLHSFILGIATGLLWAPCAGPILGLILTGAALQGASFGSSTLLLAYALGATTSLGLALLIGGKLLVLFRRYLGVDILVRKILGLAVLLGVAVIALGLDRGALTQLSRLPTESIEEKLLGLFHPPVKTIQNNEDIPELDGAVGWLNSAPLNRAALKGKVVLVDFWTYSCINCLRTLPYVKAWSEKYRTQGLVVIGVHTPEFAFEKVPANVQKAVAELGITYPIAIDNNFSLWRAFKNQYWPAHYFVDAQGKIRHQHSGEGEYEESERVLQKLLSEINGTPVKTDFVKVEGRGALADRSHADVKSRETYVGYQRSKNQVHIPSSKPNVASDYRTPPTLQLNEWGLSGRWKVEAERASLVKAPGKIIFRFHARDLHLVLGPLESGQEIRFKVRLDGQAPLENHGVDINEKGEGRVKDQRLYQLIRQSGKDLKDRTFEIEFLDPEVSAFAFTFG